MIFRNLDLVGLVEITPSRIADDRGYFVETFRADAFDRHVGRHKFVQDNQSHSVAAGTVRGLHFQTAPFAQGKLVRCLAGSLFDVALDIRYGSPTYGRSIAVTLSSGVGNQLWIPPGFAHGFCTLEAGTTVAYRTTAYYSARHDRGVAWDDPVVAIGWPPVVAPYILSAKDRALPNFADLPEYFHYGEDA